MIGLRATAVAEGMPDRFAARVHSAFGSACNLVIDDGPETSGTLVPLVSAHHPMPPGAIKVHLPPGFRFDRHLRTGTAAALRAGTLRIGGELSVTLHGAEPWRTELPELHWRGGTSARDTAWRIAWKRVRRSPRHEASSAVERHLAALTASLFRRDGDLAVRSAATLIGLGPGLTPSGDDILVGVLAVMHGAAGEPRIARMRDGLIHAVRTGATRTTDIGRSYLLHACAGRIGEALTNFARALAQGDDPLAATECALAVGAHSGADGALGLLAALASLHPDPARLGFPE